MAKLIRHWIRRFPSGPQLLIPNSQFPLPMVAKTSYLGIMKSIIELGKRTQQPDEYKPLNSVFYFEAVAPGIDNSAAHSGQIVLTVCYSYCIIMGP